MIQIVFENENFVVCDKPSGVLSTPSREGKEDPRPCLGTKLQERLGVRIFPVHRLDFEVSGLILYAKTPQAHSQANAWFEKKQVTKTYRALSQPQSFSHIPANVANPRQALPLEEGAQFVWEARILRGKRRAYESPQGKPSLTEAVYLGLNNDGFLRWDLRPISGRSHQLRFDLSRHGFPILGDALYGSSVDFAPDSIALRSYKIDFSRAPGALALGLGKQLETESY